MGMGVGHAHHSWILRRGGWGGGAECDGGGGGWVSGYLEYGNPTVRLGRDRRARRGGGDMTD